MNCLDCGKKTTGQKKRCPEHWRAREAERLKKYQGAAYANLDASKLAKAVPVKLKRTLAEFWLNMGERGD